VTRGDRIVVAAVAVLALASWPLAALAGASGRADIAVVTGPKGVTELRLDAAGRYAVDGLRGTVELVVEGGTVRVAGSSCPDRLCVHQGRTRTPGSAIVCVPNGVTVRIGGGQHAPDAVVR
jgi:hypothetical protein